MAKTVINGRNFKVFKAVPTAEKTVKADGELISADKDGIKIACGGGQVIALTEIQAEGGKRMSVEVFLRGNRL